nr:MAG TPA: hypothetical protein [Caudoviricetes sp.]
MYRPSSFLPTFRRQKWVLATFILTRGCFGT